MDASKVLYIDGDILPYRVGFACQTNEYTVTIEGESSPFMTESKREVNELVKQHGEDKVTYYTEQRLETPIQATLTMEAMIREMVQMTECKKFVTVLSGKENFRQTVATIQPYKGNRDGSEKPHHWQMLRDWLEAKPYNIVAEGEEADDVLSKALMAGHPIATLDKDLNNTPGVHYNFVKKVLSYVTEEEAMFNFYQQMLVGDTIDNIPGIRGIGPAKSKKLLQDCTRPIEYENAIRPVYEDTYGGQWFKAMTEVGRLLWMRRVDNEMWHPVMGSHLEVIGGDDVDDNE